MWSKAKDKLSGLLYDLYTRLYREGYTYDECLSISADIAYNFFEYKDTYATTDTKIKKIYNQYFKVYEDFFKSGEFSKPQFDEEIFLIAIKEVISKWEEQAPPEKRRTEPNVIKIMQAFAKQLLPSGPYSDISVGTGGIIENLDNVKCLQDINKRLLDVAVIIKKIADKDSYSFTYTANDSTINLGQTEGVVLFDPPMGDLRTHPKGWKDLDNKI